MKVLYFDCFSGISGDMVLGGLLDLGLNPKVLRSSLAKLGLPGIDIKVAKVRRKGLAGTKFDVKLNSRDNRQNRRFSSLGTIITLINKSSLNDRVKLLSRQIFENLASAESRAHGRTKGKVHFHQIGDLDSIVDIVGTTIAVDHLGIEKFYSSSLNLGGGISKRGSELEPIPAFATSYLLEGLPVYSSDIPHELVTPTGAAIVKTLCSRFGPMPPMEVRRVGYGAGTCHLRQAPNLLRVIMGEASSTKDPSEVAMAMSSSEVATAINSLDSPEVGSECSPQVPSYKTDTIMILETNLHDMNPVGFEYLEKRLFEVGALDFYFTPVQAKKSRPGLLLTVLVEPHRLDRVAEVIFEETPTMGLRFYEAKREKLERKSVEVKTGFGVVRVKLGMVGKRINTVSPEYRDCKNLANKLKVPFRTVYEEAKTRSCLLFGRHPKVKSS